MREDFLERVQVSAQIVGVVRIFLSFILVALWVPLAHGKELPHKSGTQWAPFVEWEVENESYEGNPFDVVATATFEHGRSGETRTTELFYAGDNTWKIRFCGTKPSRWTFRTESSDEDLNGLTGSVQINHNLSGYGFVTSDRSKWARQKGRTPRLEAFLPQYVMYKHPLGIYEDRERVGEDIQTFLIDHGFTGFHVPVYCRWFDIEKDRASEIDVEDPNPDHRTFEVLEQFIKQVYDAGGVVHFWAWGDEARTQTPHKWGLNGKADRRLQRYIAARLGPIPGWTMGYGFDLDEWVNEEQLGEWRDFMHEHMAWPHLLGGRHGDPNRGEDHSSAISWNKVLDYASFEHHQPTPEVYAAALAAVPDKPVFSEDRFRIRQSDRYREKDYTEEMTRRGLWQSTMVGGVANIWGKLDGQMDINMGFGASLPYDNPHWVKTWSRFFKGRFELNSKVVEDPLKGLVLRKEDAKRFVVYTEDAAVVEIDLSDLSSPLPVVAVDTKLPYLEVDLGYFKNVKNAWRAPYTSDWALAVGYFGQPYPDSLVARGIFLDWSTHQRHAPGSDNFQLTWSDDDHLYGAWGDGGGFYGTNGNGRVGLGFARVEGNRDDYRGFNVWGGFEAQNSATFEGKSWATISLEGDLYMWVVPDHPEGKSYRNHYEYVELAKSEDKGASWSKASWRFEQSEGLTIPTFLNFGKDNADVPVEFGDYVYSYFLAPQSTTMEQEGPNGVNLMVHRPGRIYLGRVLGDRLMGSKENHQFFTGRDALGQPTWGRLEDKQPVFEDENGVGWCLSASYNPHLDRVILVTQHRQTTSGLLGIFDAPTPWGPWSTIEYFEIDAPFGKDRPGSELPWANNVFFAAFPTKWLDEETFVLNFTGGGRGKDNDSFNTVEGRFILR